MGEPRRREERCDRWLAGGRGNRAETYGALIWLAVWLWPLLGPVIAVARGRVDPVLPAAFGLLAFVPLYLAVMTLAWRDQVPSRRRLLAMLAVLAALGLALAAGYAGQPDTWLIPLLFVAVSGAAALRAPVHVFGWLSGVVLALVVVGMVRGVAGGEIGSTAFSTVMSGILVFVIRRMNLLIDQLRATRAELAEAAVAQERMRFSRDLHDLLGHTLSVMVVKATAVRRLAERDPALAAREAGEIEEIGRRALVEVREAVTGYRERRLSTELDGARKALAGAGIDVTIRESGGALPAAAESVFGWAVREGVTNVIRHSGASRCDIDIDVLGEHAVLEIRDNGTGDGDTTAAGNGLRGIAERVRAAGGTVESGRCRDGGFRLAARIPLVVEPQLVEPEAAGSRSR
jgi:two-component system sensor histidine kinase DesK